MQALVCKFIEIACAPTLAPSACVRRLLGQPARSRASSSGSHLPARSLARPLARQDCLGTNSGEEYGSRPPTLSLDRLILSVCNCGPLVGQTRAWEKLFRGLEKGRAKGERLLDYSGPPPPASFSRTRERHFRRWSAIRKNLSSSPSKYFRIVPSGQRNDKFFWT